MDKYIEFLKNKEVRIARKQSKPFIKRAYLIFEMLNI